MMYQVTQRGRFSVHENEIEKRELKNSNLDYTLDFQSGSYK